MQNRVFVFLLLISLGCTKQSVNQFNPYQAPDLSRYAPAGTDSTPTGYSYFPRLSVALAKGISKSEVQWVVFTNEMGGVLDSIPYSTISQISNDLIAPSPNVFVPNAFSPNGDGINDRFEVYSNCELVNYNLAVFNRWGTPLFESTERGNTWDGYYNSELLQGNYYYSLSFQYVSPNYERLFTVKVMKGYFTLVY